MEAKVRLAGAVVEVAGATVEEEDGESAGALQAEEADEGLDTGETSVTWAGERLGEVTSGVLFGAGEEGLEDPAGVFDPCKEGGESIGLEMTWADGWEEWDFLGSLVFSVEDGDLVDWEGAAERLLESSEGGICVGEGGELPPRTGRDPWVLTAVGVDSKSFSMFPGIKKKSASN